MDSAGVEQILRALSVVHEAALLNAQRQAAQGFLERLKQDAALPLYGYELAQPRHNSVVRHFGLLLLQHAATRLPLLPRDTALALRRWTVDLCRQLQPADPHYMTEKLAYLWSSVAKRVWGAHLRDGAAAAADADAEGGWALMDADLWLLWRAGGAPRELLLAVLRTLFEDVYLLDDAVASRRSGVLNQLCVLVVTPQRVLDTLYEPAPALAACRALRDGWFAAWLLLLAADAATLARVLAALKTCLHWVHPLVLREHDTLAALVRLLAVADTRVQTLAVDCLHVLVSRLYAPADFDDFVGQVFRPDGIAALLRFYDSLALDPARVDEPVYALVKKTAEMLVGLSEHLNVLLPPKSRVLWEHSDVALYLRLVLRTTAHDSLVVSGLLLQMWVTTLRVDELSARAPVVALLPELLELAADRVVDPTALDLPLRRFLELDFDLGPDAALFLQNYRKFNEDIVRITVCKNPDAGIRWLEQRLERFFSGPVGRQCIAQLRLAEKLPALAYATAHFTIIENSIRGVSRWRIWYTGPDLDARNTQLNALVEALGKRLLAMQLALPLLIRKQVQTLVQFAPLLKDVSPLMFDVLEKILHTATFEYPPDIDDDEKELIRDLRTSCGTELNRLAYIMPEALKRIFAELEAVVADILALNKVSSHENVAFKLFLLVIALRLLIDNKEALFAKIVDPELQAWAAPETEKGLLDLHWFMERMGIVEIAQYFQKRNITAATNLLEARMDDEGRALKNRLKDHWLLIFPIRATRIYIQYSIEKLAHDSPEYQALLLLWKPRVRPIVPHILRLLTQIQAYHNPSNWRDLPEAVQMFLHYSKMERFWQQGISIQSKETFIEESVRAALTLRDFADSVGHLIRYTREYAFLTIGLLLQLEETLYEMPGVASQLWLALAGDTAGVTLHSWKHMINSCLRSVVKNCPPRFTDAFMGELLPRALCDIDKVVAARWEKVYLKGLQLQGNEDDASLSEEMMEEHMLRQLTATVVRLLMDIVPQVNAKNVLESQEACKRLVTQNPAVMGAFLQICTRIIALKDTKCLFNTVLIVRNLLPAIVLKDDEVDKYLCDTLLKTLVGVLMDEYFQETHLEAATALTTLYCLLRLKNDAPAQCLMAVLPNIDLHHIANFELLLVGLRSLRHQRLAFLELVRIAKTPDEADEAELKFRKRQLELGVGLKKKQPSDLMSDPFTENGALNNLFGDD